MEKNKKFGVILMIAVLLVGVYFIFFYDKKNNKNEQATKQEKISNADRIAKELADKYQATIGWEGDITYTLQAQEKLITGKPTLFKGYVDDIFTRDGKTFIRFSSSYINNYFDYVLELECNRSVVDTILAQKKDDRTFAYLFNTYIIVANIQEVSKTTFALKGSALSEDDVEINIESSGLFTAKGTCVDIAYIAED
jgi:hypothetical protein